jgi:integrase
MLRRAAQLVAPNRDYSWLIEIEKDLAFVMTPRSKQDRLVMTEVLLEAGLTLFAEAEAAGHRSRLDRACMARNGLMIALLSIFPFRLKNFAALEIGRTFVNMEGSWWFVLPGTETKERSHDERRVHRFLNPLVERYIEHYRPVLGREKQQETALWLSWRNGRPLSYFSIEPIITGTTRSAIGVGVSPHMFRSAGATSAAVHKGEIPYLASALLHHRDRRIANRHYNRATTFQAAEAFARMIAFVRD